MIFCPKCGSILRPNKENGKTIMVCSCGYKSKEAGSLKIKEQVKRDDVKIGVVDKEPELMPKIEQECPKCGNKEAFYWTIQTRAADEAPTRFFKCTKCKKTWREYS